MRLFKTMYLVLAAALLAACSTEDTSDITTNGEKVEVNFTFSSRALSGAGTPQDPVEDVERFDHYWVVFTSTTSSDKIVKIVKKDCASTERDEFMVELGPGTYKVYGFANISDDYLEGLGIVEGQTMPDLSATLIAPYERYFGAGVTTLLPVDVFTAETGTHNTGIPMTSVNGVVVNVTNAITVDKAIEVVRLFAKIEFNIKNDTEDDVTLLSQTVSNLTMNGAGGEAPVRLMYYDPSAGIDLSANAHTATLSHTYTGGQTIAVGETLNKAFYVLESRANAITGGFQLGFNIDGQDMRYGLTDANVLTQLCRNDWLRIPISLSDWQMRLKVRTLAPIGGYPEATIDEGENGDFVVELTAAGDISILPEVRKYKDGDNWFHLDNGSRILGTPTISVSGDDIFVSGCKPQYAAGGAITARIKTGDEARGTACVTVSAKIITNPGAGTPVTKTITRKIYLHRA